MLKILVFAVIALAMMSGAANAQSDDPARLRVMQLSYRAPSSGTADVQIDEAVVFAGVSFPFVTTYIELAAGNHTLTMTLSDQPDATASTPLNLEPGHTYSVVIHGDYTEEVTFTLVDETGLLRESTGTDAGVSTAVVVNLTPDPITEIALDGVAVLDHIPAGGYGSLSLPLAEVTITGKVGDRPYSETYGPLAHARLLVAVRLTPSGEVQVIIDRSSDWTVAAYLRSLEQGAAFASVAEVLGAAGVLDALADDGEFTLFLPANDAFDRLSDAFPTDSDQLKTLLAHHIVAQNLPPTALPGHEQLASLAGDPLTLAFSSTESGYWEIEGAPILWDIRLANGVIYAIDGAILPSE